MTLIFDFKNLIRPQISLSNFSLPNPKDFIIETTFNQKHFYVKKICEEFDKLKILP